MEHRIELTVKITEVSRRLSEATGPENKKLRQKLTKQVAKIDEELQSLGGAVDPDQIPDDAWSKCVEDRSSPKEEGKDRSSEEKGDASRDEGAYDERPDLRRELHGLREEIAAEATALERRAAAEVEASQLEETLADLDRFEELQDELEKLEDLRGPGKKAAKPRIAAIEKELNRLEAKHTKVLKAAEAEPPAGVEFLTMSDVKKKLKVLVTSDEKWAKHQCALSHKLTGGKALPMLFDGSANGKARKAGLGKRGVISDLDESDASAKVLFGDKTSAWYPVATLSLQQRD